MTVTVMLLMEARDVPKDRLGLAGGVFFTVAEIGGVLGPFSFGLLLDLSGTIHLPLGAISLAALILGLLLVRLRALHARA
jgi:predicted MFS family arabinose efflux permease